MKNIYKIFSIVVLLLSISACRQKEENNTSSAPQVECGDIEVNYGGNFSIYDYCLIDESTTLTADPVDTSSPGVYYISVVASKGESYNVFDVKVTVKDKPKPDCEGNTEYNEETKKCECKEGYVASPEGEGCVLESDIKKEDDPKPDTEPQPEPVTEPENGKTFSASTYGSMDAAFNACVLECKSISGTCNCSVNSSYTGYILTR